LPSLDTVKEKLRHGGSEHQKRPLVGQEQRKHGSTRLLLGGGMNALIERAEEIKQENRKRETLLQVKVIPNPNDKGIGRGGSGANWSTKTGSGSNSAASPNAPQAKLRA
jgi:hypothetical protein